MLPADDQSNRLFVGDQTGKIHVLKTKNYLQTPFLDLTSKDGEGQSHLR